MVTVASDDWQPPAPAVRRCWRPPPTSSRSPGAGSSTSTSSWRPVRSAAGWGSTTTSGGRSRRRGSSSETPADTSRAAGAQPPATSSTFRRRTQRPLTSTRRMKVSDVPGPVRNHSGCCPGPPACCCCPMSPRRTSRPSSPGRHRARAMAGGAAVLRDRADGDPEGAAACWTATTVCRYNRAVLVGGEGVWEALAAETDGELRHWSQPPRFCVGQVDEPPGRRRRPARWRPWSAARGPRRPWSAGTRRCGGRVAPAIEAAPRHAARSWPPRCGSPGHSSFRALGDPAAAAREADLALQRAAADRTGSCGRTCR